MSFMSSRLVAPPSLSSPYQPRPFNPLLRHTHLLRNPACSCVNALKSLINLSIASFMCMCRTSVQILSASERVAVLSSIAPSADLILYLRGKRSSGQLGGEWRARLRVVAHRYVVPSSTGRRSLTMA